MTASFPPVAVLLVAGVGSRLRPLTDDRPKALLDVGGETLLARTVRLLADAGARRLVLATGYRADAVRDALAGCPLPVTCCPNPAFDRTQNSVSLHLCAEAIGDEDFVKLDGDVLFRPEVLTRLAASPGELAVAVDRRAGLGAEEMKVTADGDRILAFGKGLDPARCAGESLGIERVAGSVAGRLFGAIGRAIDGGRVDLYYEHLYDELLGGGLDARVVDVTDLAWTEIDTFEDLEAARSLVRSGKLA